MVGMLFISVVIPMKASLGIVYYFKLIPEFSWQNTACFSAVHKPDASVDYTLFDYVIFPYQSITLHKNKVYSRCFDGP